MTRREVTLQGGPPWGFRITGGADQHHPLKVSLVGWHRRRIKTEEKAKVVPSVRGEEIILFLAALAVLRWTT